MGNSCSLAVACDVFDGVFCVLSCYPRDVFDEIWDLIGSVSEGFPTFIPSLPNCFFLFIH